MNMIKSKKRKRGYKNGKDKDYRYLYSSYHSF